MIRFGMPVNTRGPDCSVRERNVQIVQGNSLIRQREGLLSLPFVPFINVAEWR